MMKLPRVSARQWRFWAAACVAFASSMAGCDCGTALRSLTPKIQVMPTSLNFSEVTVGTIAEKPLEVSNVGRGPLLISSVTVADMNDVTVPTSELLIADCNDNPRNTVTPLTIEPGQCARIQVRFAPTKVETLATSIIITSNDPQQPKVTVPVTATSALQPLPQIQVCVLDASGMQVDSQCTNFTATPPVIPTVDFGTVEYGVASPQKLRINNIGTSPLTVSAVRVLSTSPDYTLPSLPVLPVTIAPNASQDVVVELTPKGDGPVDGKVVILSNDTKEAEVDIPIKGVEDGPCLQVMPGTLDFGTVTIGMSKQLSLSLENCGHSSYNITTLKFSPTVANTRVFSLSSPDPSGLPTTPLFMNPGEMHTLNLTYTPDTPTPASGPGDTGLFTIATDYNATQIVKVIARASGPECGGANSPVAKIQVLQNGMAVNGSVLPLSTVTLSGAGSTAPSSATISSYTWRLISAPMNSTTSLQGSGTTTTLLCSLAGTYQVGLTVKDSNGCQSAETVANIVVSPSNGIHVELTWKQNFGDVDLHFVGPNGTFADGPWNGRTGGSDLYYLYAMQTFNGPGSPVASGYPYGYGPIDWGKNKTTQPDGITTDDPSLDADQLWGKGPENVTYPHPFDGTYKVMVHFYCSSALDQGGSSRDLGPVDATITIYVNGAVAWQGTQTIHAKNVWTAATIQVTNGVATVTPVTLMTSPLTRSMGCGDGN